MYSAGAKAMLEPAETIVRVVAQGASWVVVDKPAGLLSVPGKGDEPHKKDCVASRVRAMFPGCGGPLIVHRLDMDTSGLLVLGLDAGAQRALSAQFERRETYKQYAALLEGILEHPAGDQGSVDLPLRLDPQHRPWQVVCALHGRAALTRFSVVAREVDRTRVHFEPVTGRAHQLRVHAATPQSCGGLGQCIQGDVLYGSGYLGPGSERDRGVMSPAPRLMLHARTLEFADPVSGARVRCESVPPF